MTQTPPPPSGGMRFNPPPGWPPADPNWMPPPGWQPDPSLPAAPPNWQWYVSAGSSPQGQKRKSWFARHKVLSAVAGIVALFVVLGVISTAVGSGSGSNGTTAAKPAGKSTSGSQTSAAPAPSPTTNPLTAAQQTFVSKMRSQFGFAGDDDATVAELGTAVCFDRKSGYTQAKTYTDTAQQVSGGGSQVPQIVRLAEQTLCKKYLAVPTVQFVVSGQGSPDITYGSDSDNRQGTGPLPFQQSLKLDESALYYDITAQLSGSGDITCKVIIDGKVVAHGHASGGYNICSAQAGKGLSGGWEQE